MSSECPLQEYWTLSPAEVRLAWSGINYGFCWWFYHRNHKKRINSRMWSGSGRRMKEIIAGNLKGRIVPAAHRCWRNHVTHLRSGFCTKPAQNHPSEQNQHLGSSLGQRWETWSGSDWFPTSVLWSNQGSQQLRVPTAEPRLVSGSDGPVSQLTSFKSRTFWLNARRCSQKLTLQPERRLRRPTRVNRLLHI